MRVIWIQVNYNHQNNENIISILSPEKINLLKVLLYNFILSYNGNDLAGIDLADRGVSFDDKNKFSIRITYPLNHLLACVDTVNK